MPEDTNFPDDWFEKPKIKPKKLQFPNWLRSVLIAIVTGVSTGTLISVIYILRDINSKFILKNQEILETSFITEFQIVLLVLIFGATFGLVIGAPAALFFGPIAVKITEKIPQKIQYWVRLLIGAIGGFIAFYIFNILRKANFNNLSNFDNLIIPILSGIIGAIIFLKLYPKKETQNERA